MSLKFLRPEAIESFVNNFFSQTFFSFDINVKMTIYIGFDLLPVLACRSDQLKHGLLPLFTRLFYLSFFLQFSDFLFVDELR